MVGLIIITKIFLQAYVKTSTSPVINLYIVTTLLIVKSNFYLLNEESSCYHNYSITPDINKCLTPKIPCICGNIFLLDFL